jgi:hypothetical protein
VQRGDDWAVTNRYTNRQTGATTRTIRTDEGSAVTRRGPGGGTVATGDGGNVYAGRDGNVYRRQDGTWQKSDGSGGWSDTDRQPTRPTPSTEGGAQNRGTTDRGTIDQLNRDSAARAEGARRTGDYGSYKGGNTRSTGSYRGGGGMRTGGGRRR